MARTSEAAFMAYYEALPHELQALRMFFRAATEYHQTHQPTVSASVQERRWARSELEGPAYARIAPEPVLVRCDKILAADRVKRIARIRERRHPRPEPVLRLDLNAGGADVIAFKPRTSSAEQQAVSA
ncbi:hypothetical protein ACLBWX_10155 [Methylobacterium sp. M6A4_1b]